MSRNRLLLLLVLLVAPAASARGEDAEDEYGESSEYEEVVQGPPKLEGSSRFSMQTGWRYAPNTAFFDTYYSHPENRALARAGGTIGGPLLVSTFAYSPLSWLEVGFDLFFTYERMSLTNKPGLNSITFGAMVGLRFQKRLELGPEGFIPFAGLLVGPTFAGSFFDGGRSIENFSQAVGLNAGGTLRLTSKWGVCFEYRLTSARGFAEKIGPYLAGGHWLSVGVTYTFPSVPDRPLGRRF